MTKLAFRQYAAYLHTIYFIVQSHNFSAALILPIEHPRPLKPTGRFAVDIKVYRNGKLTESPLCAFINNGRAYTVMRTSRSRFGGFHRLRLTDELAHEVLGAERRTCPYVGQEPRIGFYSKGYFANRVIIGDGLTTVRRQCKTCGYTADIHASRPLTHPETSYLESAKSGLPFAHADWDASLEAFTLSRTAGNLILWVIPPRARTTRPAGPRGFGGAADATSAFPAAESIFKNEWFILLREPSPV